MKILDKFYFISLGYDNELSVSASLFFSFLKAIKDDDFSIVRRKCNDSELSYEFIYYYVDDDLLIPFGRVFVDLDY